jgi:hypothetical protein
MKDMKYFSCFPILVGMVLVLYCISTSAYASSEDELTIGVEPWFPILDIPDRGGPINLEDIKHAELQLLSYPPRFNGDMSFGLEPIDIRAIFDSYNLSTNSYGIASSFDVTSSSMEGSVVAIPEPATVLLLGMGALALRKRKRA